MKSMPDVDQPMTIFNDVRAILVDLLDVEPAEIGAGTYLVRDLGIESIDFLELAVALNSRFKVRIEDNDIFLFGLRAQLAKAGPNPAPTPEALQAKFPFLSQQRLMEILQDLDYGPVVKVADLVAYIQWRKAMEAAA